MKKRIAMLICAAMMLPILAGCGKTETASQAGGKKLSIVTTIFPEYDWLVQLLGDRAAEVEMTLLLDSGVDLHSFQPSAKDIVTISNCDLFVYVGGESDKWVDAALAGAANQNRIVLNLLDILQEQVKEEEIIEGMDAHEEEEHEDEHEEAPEYDEHVWLSLRNAGTVCQVLRDALISLDEANKDIYTANADAYLQKLDALDKQYQQAVDSSNVKTLLFGDRFPFRYLTDDYGLNYFAAFPGCSAETEASFETIVFLSEKLKELELPHVMTLEGSDGKIAQTIIDTAALPEVSILSMNSMQSCTMKDVSEGVTYLSVMEKNLDVLKTALNREG